MPAQQPSTYRADECLSSDITAAYVANTLDDEAVRQIEAHLVRCANCRTRVASHAADEQLASAIKEAYDSTTELLPGKDVPKGPGTSGLQPDAVEGYEICDEIHRGGQGAVFEAVQLATRRTVALKVLLHGAFASDRQRRRFEREIEMVAGLRHPNIVTVYDSGVMSGDRPYFAMEYVDGVPLDRYVETRRAEALKAAGHRLGAAVAADRAYSLEDALRLFLKVCLAISYAHQHGVIHRDLKPSNILIDAEGEPHILDFGLAKTALEVGDTPASVTLDGEFLGTAAYASPEQIKGDPPLDVRSDVYSLGVILYRLLTNRFPYRVEGALGDVFDQIAKAEPQPPSVWYKRHHSKAASHDGRTPFRVNSELDAIVLTALQKACEHRYQSVADLARDIEHYLAGEPIAPKRSSSWYVLRKTLHRHRISALVAGAFLAVVAEAALVSVIYWYQVLMDAERVAHAEASARQRVAGEVLARDNWELMAIYQTNLLESMAARDARAEELVRQVLGISPHTPETEYVPPSEAAPRSATQPARLSFAEAEDTLLRLQRILEAQRGPADKRRLRAIRELVRLYEAWGRPDAAARWQAELPRPPNVESGS